MLIRSDEIEHVLGYDLVTVLTRLNEGGECAVQIRIETTLPDGSGMRLAITPPCKPTPAKTPKEKAGMKRKKNGRDGLVTPYNKIVAG